MGATGFWVPVLTGNPALYKGWSFPSWLDRNRSFPLFGAVTPSNFKSRLSLTPPFFSIGSYHDLHSHISLDQMLQSVRAHEVESVGLGVPKAENDCFCESSFSLATATFNLSAQSFFMSILIPCCPGMRSTCFCPSQKLAHKPIFRKRIQFRGVAKDIARSIASNQEILRWKKGHQHLDFARDLPPVAWSRCNA